MSPPTDAPVPGEDIPSDAFDALCYWMYDDATRYVPEDEVAIEWANLTIDNADGILSPRERGELVNHRYGWAEARVDAASGFAKRCVKLGIDFRGRVYRHADRMGYKTPTFTRNRGRFYPITATSPGYIRREWPDTDDAVDPFPEYAVNRDDVDPDEDRRGAV